MNRTSRHPMRRILLAAVVLVALVGVFVVRLVDIQVVRAAELNEEAEGRRSTDVTVYGARGDIVDTNGNVLADSVMRYDIAVSPKNASAGPVVREQPDPDDPDTTVRVDVPLEQSAAELGAVLGLTGEQVKGIIDAKLAENPESDFAYVAKLVDTATYERVKALDIPWVVPWEHPSRRYPNGAVAGNLLGFVGDDGDALAGLELSRGRVPRGRGRRAQLPAQPRGLGADPGHRGDPQAGARRRHAPPHDRLRPAVDGAAHRRGAGAGRRRRLGHGHRHGGEDRPPPRRGRRADGRPERPGGRRRRRTAGRGRSPRRSSPGSTFKAITAASVIDGGKADPLSQIIAPYRYLPPNGADVNDSGYHEDEPLTLTGVLIESSNTGMSQFGERLSDQERYDDMLAFGLGQRTEVGFPGEEPGDLHGGPEAWDNQTKYATMFGQGLTTTAVQIASAYQTLANGGVRMPVRLVDGCTDADGDETVPQSDGTRVVSEAAADQTSQMLERVYLEGWLADKWEIPGYRVAAKTGTAQVPDGNGGYLSGYLVSVSGFAPADDPQFVVSVSIMNPVKMNSSAASAPVFQQVMSQVLKKYRTVPSGAPAPELPATW